MSDDELSVKKSYFQNQDLLDVSDDEQYDMGESSKAIERMLVDSKVMPPPRLITHSSSFLGPTPKELQAEFEAHAKMQRAFTRQDAQKLARSSTVPESDVTKSFTVTKPSPEPFIARGKRGEKLRRTSSLPSLPVPFYKRMGNIPRELSKGKKKAGLAENIEVRPEATQLLKEKVVYFYPNDDVSMLRRMRIHNIIQLGAAWVKSWRDDVTHIITDDETVTYGHLLTHLKLERVPVSTRLCSPTSLLIGQKEVILVQYQPYVTDSIRFGELQDPSRRRFRVQDAPLREATNIVQATQLSATSQKSLKIKPSGRQLTAQESRKSDSYPNEEKSPSQQPAVEPPAPIFEERVEDSFIMPSPEPNETKKTGDQFNDALSLAIQEAKAIAHLPLDDDDDEYFSKVSERDTDDSGTDDEPTKAEPKLAEKFSFVSKASALRDKGSLKLSAFQCMDPGASGYTSQNPNVRTIQILEEMCKHYDQMQDNWRTLSYRKCIATLKKQSIKITTAKQAIALPTIGHRLADKIEEIVLTDCLRKLDYTRNDPLDTVLRLFLGVYGAGLVQANKWIQAGHRTLADLESKAKLTPCQKIGLQHYADFNARIPRAEVEAHANHVRSALRNINPDYEAITMGSYRRGAADSGDVDIIITCPDTPLSTIHSTVFDNLIPHLFTTHFLKASLAASNSHSHSHSTTPSGSKWHGASCLPGSHIWRRIDLLLVPEPEMGAALIYFTGNDVFNRSVRLLARKRGMRLNQRGLFRDVERGLGGQRLNEGVLVEGRCERRIFEVLGVPWREPGERVC
ncbi:hypothetical protein IAQ61_006010 [Plenodomus lingam]|uniref:DNA-directed DNA polymerase n=1 Tax=Leptosphaeria maculans (strain JN3 / isolate v23.1.3 / race Av1-4-5-6-7-8) TaxID=985895 RepID=E4ZMZ8_LEPMJ|nr:hypothetical protein LEMA_P053070.1 [Plenodomus lingam JN3]KAH9870534.1 hypothetical protein IAQ61_006010 [Plenodomus lingam]CBX92601.1 hypothetical protein LEMA_P053070.1 [Plenodomus lingam JN3]